MGLQERRNALRALETPYVAIANLFICPRRQTPDGAENPAAHGLTLSCMRLGSRNGEAIFSISSRRLNAELNDLDG